MSLAPPAAPLRASPSSTSPTCWPARSRRISSPASARVSSRSKARTAISRAGWALLRPAQQRMGISFLAVNAGKESIALDLKHPDGKTILRRLVERADCLIENFRPGVMTRLQLHHTVLKLLSVPEIMNHVQTETSELIAAYDEVRGTARPVRAARPGFRIDGVRPHAALPPPQLSAQRDKLLAELGLDANECAALVQSGAVR